MRILHYSLGFPPYRTGGLTKYCTDLMLEQKDQGHEVALIWPGRINLLKKKTEICSGKKWNDIGNYELVNPLPVPLDEGIIDIDAFTKKVDESIYLRFLKYYNPDVIHIHTLMGLHEEFIWAANKLGITTVFTSHDYFGICPKVTLFYHGSACDHDGDCKECVQCNKTALSINKITILQSSIYRRLKDTSVIKILRKRHRQEFFDDSIVLKEEANEEAKARDYIKLRQYYVSMLEMVDIIHFNSSISEAVYKKYINPKNSAMIPITHRDVKDHRQLKNFEYGKLRITYLGPAKPFKGFQFLLGVLDRMWDKDIREFELHIYSETREDRPYISIKQNGYPYDQLQEIFYNTDVLVVPSQWYETFGFTVLEALSYGVPVISSDIVGAADIDGVVRFKHDDSKELETKIRELLKSKERRIELNSKYLGMDFSQFLMKNHIRQIEMLYNIQSSREKKE